MRIQLWQAFASNNSGSYTIVGRFDDGERAAEVARELGEMIVAHARVSGFGLGRLLPMAGA